MFCTLTIHVFSVTLLSFTFAHCFSVYNLKQTHKCVIQSQVILLYTDDVYIVKYWREQYIYLFLNKKSNKINENIVKT